MGSILSGAGATKNAIVQLLSEQWPLSIKKIYSHIRKQGKSITYQAVYKAIKELLGEGTLSRHEAGYMISPQWVENSSEFINKLAESYGKNDLSKRRIQELTFSSFGEAIHFIIANLNSDFFGSSDEVFWQLRRFFLFPLSQSDISALRDFFSKRKVYILCRENSALDKFGASFMRSLGAKAITGIQCAHPSNVIVIGNCVINLYVMNNKDRPRLCKYYNGTKDMKPEKQGILKICGSILRENIQIRFVINRDSGVLSDVLEQTRLIIPNYSKPSQCSCT
jgi:hypothetical protein